MYSTHKLAIHMQVAYSIHHIENCYSYLIVLAGSKYIQAAPTAWYFNTHQVKTNEMQPENENVYGYIYNYIPSIFCFNARGPLHGSVGKSI